MANGVLELYELVPPGVELWCRPETNCEIRRTRSDDLGDCRGDWAPGDVLAHRQMLPSLTFISTLGSIG